MSLCARWRIQTTKTPFLIVSWLLEKNVPVNDCKKFTKSIIVRIISNVSYNSVDFVKQEEGPFKDDIPRFLKGVKGSLIPASSGVKGLTWLKLSRKGSMESHYHYTWNRKTQYLNSKIAKFPESSHFKTIWHSYFTGALSVPNLYTKAMVAKLNCIHTFIGRCNPPCRVIGAF